MLYSLQTHKNNHNTKPLRVTINIKIMIVIRVCSDYILCVNSNYKVKLHEAIV